MAGPRPPVLLRNQGQLAAIIPPGQRRCTDVFSGMKINQIAVPAVHMDYRLNLLSSENWNNIDYAGLPVRMKHPTVGHKCPLL
jgi:hypothetical protein